MFTHKKSVILYLLPGLLGLTIFYVVPFIGGIWYSFTDGSYKNAFIWFDNYKSVWANPMFRLGLQNTMFFSVVCTPLAWVLSFILASLLSGVKPHGAFVRSSVLMPYLMPSSAILLIWLLLFDYGGPVNRLIVALGLPRVFWLEGAALRVPVILMFLWKNLGFSAIIFLAAFQAIPAPLYEYARLEGAGFFYRAWHITLPLTIPSAFLVFVMAWINAFKIFKEVYFIGGAYPDEKVYTLQNYMNNMYSKLNYQYVTTAAYSFALIVFAIFGVMFFLQKQMLKRLS